MRAVRGRGTGPEALVKAIIQRLGYRVRVQAANLPGKPDFILPEIKAAVFVHGCFWHGHAIQGCRGRRVPKSNRAYWVAKIERNRHRDRRVRRQLRTLGWIPIVIWECRLRRPGEVERRLGQGVK